MPHSNREMVKTGNRQLWPFPLKLGWCYRLSGYSLPASWDGATGCRVTACRPAGMAPEAVGLQPAGQLGWRHKLSGYSLPASWDGAIGCQITACWPATRECKIDLPAMPWTHKKVNNERQFMSRDMITWEFEAKMLSFWTKNELDRRKESVFCLKTHF